MAVAIDASSSSESVLSKSRMRAAHALAAGDGGFGVGVVFGDGVIVGAGEAEAAGFAAPPGAATAALPAAIETRNALRVAMTQAVRYPRDGSFRHFPWRYTSMTTGMTTGRRLVLVKISLEMPLRMCSFTVSTSRIPSTDMPSITLRASERSSSSIPSASGA